MWGHGGYNSIILDLGTIWSYQLHDPASLTLGTEPGTHWIGGWMGSRAGLNPMEARKITCSYREVIQPVCRTLLRIATCATFVKTLLDIQNSTQIGLCEKLQHLRIKIFMCYFLILINSDMKAVKIKWARNQHSRSIK
jgi:hypothetical protein